MSFTPETLAGRERFLTPHFFGRLKATPQSSDPFTLSGDLPRAFQTGGCTADVSSEKANVKVILFWRSDFASSQRIINVRAVKHENKWLIDGIENAG